MINIFIQARMSSSRYPGKVLAPVLDKPMIKHLLDNAKAVQNANKNVNKVVVLTSLDATDDPLVNYLSGLQQDYFRGDLNNVFARFRGALKSYPCEYFIRLCADSPLINTQLMDAAISCIEPRFDVVSNVYCRKFPKGQGVEIVKSSVFEAIDIPKLKVDEIEHVTPYFYKNPDKFKILSLESNKDESHINMCVDTLEELKAMNIEKPSYSFSIENLCRKLI